VRVALQGGCVGQVLRLLCTSTTTSLCCLASPAFITPWQQIPQMGALRLHSSRPSLHTHRMQPRPVHAGALCSNAARLRGGSTAAAAHQRGVLTCVNHPATNPHLLCWQGDPAALPLLRVRRGPPPGAAA
jgi:hypothetical protein